MRLLDRASQSRVLAVSLIVVASAVLTAYFYAPILGGEFGLVDDHEIFRYLDGATHLNPLQIPSTLMNETEVGNWGHGARFRPVFYVAKLVESSAFGLNPGLWFAWRIAILALFVATVALMAFLCVMRSLRTNRLGIWLGTAIAFFGAIGAVSLPTWTGIVLRLGPSEIYVALGLGISAWGYFRIVTARPPRLGWVLVSVGTVIAIGSKEDALPLAFFMTIAVIIDRRRVLGDKLLILFTSSTLLFGLFVALGVFLATSGASQDVYGASRNIRGIASLLLDNQFLFVALLPPFVMTSRLFILARGEKDDSLNDRLKLSGSTSIRLIVALSYLPLTIVVTEAYFYQNAYSEVIAGTQGLARYGLLTQFSYLVSFLFIVVFVISRLKRRVQYVVGFLLIFALFFASWLGLATKLAFGTYREIASDTAFASQQLAERMKDTSGRVKASDLPVLILIQDPLEYEFAYSFPLYLNSFASVDDVTLGFLIDSGDVTDPSMKDLLNALEGMTVLGNFDGGWRINRGGPSNESNSYFCVAFRDPVNQELPWCDSLSVVN